MSEINEGVRILVERMKTNPEEFREGVYSKWAEALNTAHDAKWLTSEEHKLLQDATTVLQRDNFTAKVLKALTKEEEYATTQEGPKRMYLNPAQVAVAKKLAGGTLTTTSGSNGTWASGAVTSSNTSASSQYATKDDLRDALTNYARAVNAREEGQA